MVLAFESGVLHFVIGLLDCVPTVPYPEFLHGIVGKLLDMESVNDRLAFGKAVLTILCMESDRFSVTLLTT